MGIMKGRAMLAWRGPIPVSAERGEADTAYWLKNPAAADAPRLVTCTIGRWVPYRTPLRFQLPLFEGGRPALVVRRFSGSRSRNVG